MLKVKERRKERRVSYRHSIWFAEGFQKKLSVGRIVDVSSSGTVFMCQPAKKSPAIGQKLVSHFSLTHLDRNGLPNIAHFTRVGHICRVERIDKSSNRIAIEFIKPLPIKPFELVIA